MSLAQFFLLPAFLALAGFVEWRKFGAEDRASGRTRSRTSFALAAMVLLSWSLVHSLVGRLGWLDVTGGTGWLDLAFQMPFVPGRFLVQRFVDSRYRLTCPLCVENILEISLWLGVMLWSCVTHVLRLVARRRTSGAR